MNFTNCHAGAESALSLASTTYSLAKVYTQPKDSVGRDGVDCTYYNERAISFDVVYLAPNPFMVA